MDSKPLISVVIPCFNHGQYIEEAISSVINSVKNFSTEIIVVNDGSTDENTIQVLNNLKFDNGISGYVIHQTNGGLANARNNGIKKASGDFIIPLDSDNKLTEIYLNEAVSIMLKDENIQIIYGDAFCFGNEVGLKKNHSIDTFKLLYSNHIDACAIFRKKVWIDVNGYSEDMPYMGCEDWNFWLKCLDNNFHFFYLNKICFEYRVLENSMIRSVKDDFYSKIFAYNTANLYSFYAKRLYDEREIKNSIFSGNFVKRVSKFILNQIGFYKY